MSRRLVRRCLLPAILALIAAVLVFAPGSAEKAWAAPGYHRAPQPPGVDLVNMLPRIVQHAYYNHRGETVCRGGQPLPVDQFMSIVQESITQATDSFVRANDGSWVYWYRTPCDSTDGMFVVLNWSRPNQSTAFFPTRGEQYFTEQLRRDGLADSAPRSSWQLQSTQGCWTYSSSSRNAVDDSPPFCNATTGDVFYGSTGTTDEDARVPWDTSKSTSNNRVHRTPKELCTWTAEVDRVLALCHANPYFNYFKVKLGAGGRVATYLNFTSDPIPADGQKHVVYTRGGDMSGYDLTDVFYASGSGTWWANVVLGGYLHSPVNS
ncbi:hypothetical protein [Crossiella cryophila]|uniref:Uncharacterized protein n=1 Tax=Crossiella cryophila TaxID=43355 RepID=A0A7W7FWG5_9PSEU|nr:hypothetical protein [Crossiella cryophila]MBB4680030.1 hypothetical protein [Crossiella cryophila]